MTTETREEGFLYGSSSPFIVNIPPVLEMRDYVTAYGYKVSAKFDFTDVPAKYHGIMLNLILLGRCHVNPLALERPNPPAKDWWDKFIEIIKKRLQ
jgi:hypothetical protein